MVSLVMLAIMAGCAAGLYFKGTLAQGVVMIFNALVAGLAAFGFFEPASKYLVQYAAGIAPWAPMICFLLLLVVVFALLQVAQMQISKEKIDLGTMPERIGRPVAGVLLGYVLTGYLLVAVAMAPLPSQYPYPRFDARNPRPASPSKALLSPDGFVTSLFSAASKGGFGPLREPKSFALFHAGYLDQLYLNRVQSKDVPLMTGAAALGVPPKAGVWNAPEGLRDAEGKPLAGPGGTSLMLVRVNLKKGAMKEGAKFTLSQMRLVCGPKGGVGHPLAGQGQPVYPEGYIGAEGRFERKGLGEIIDVSQAQGDPLTMDLGFFVPTDLKPVLLEFKRNNVVQLSAPAPAEEAPQPIAFSVSAPPAAGTNGPAGQPGDQTAAGAAPASQAGPAATAPSSKGKGRNRGVKGRLTPAGRAAGGGAIPEE